MNGEARRGVLPETRGGSHAAAAFFPPPNIRRMNANRTFFFFTAVGVATVGFTGSLALNHQSSHPRRTVGLVTYSSTYTG